MQFLAAYKTFIYILMFTVVILLIAYFAGKNDGEEEAKKGGFWDNLFGKDEPKASELPDVQVEDQPEKIDENWTAQVAQRLNDSIKGNWMFDGGERCEACEDFLAMDDNNGKHLLNLYKNKFNKTLRKSIESCVAVCSYGKGTSKEIVLKRIAQLGGN